MAPAICAFSSSSKLLGIVYGNNKKCSDLLGHFKFCSVTKAPNESMSVSILFSESNSMSPSNKVASSELLSIHSSLTVGAVDDLMIAFSKSIADSVPPSSSFGSVDAKCENF